MKKSKKEDVHYGREIRKKLKEHGMSVAEFARRIHCSRNNVYSIFKRKYLNTGSLEKISTVLNFDFIHDL